MLIKNWLTQSVMWTDTA